jgi:hypothetical protein
MAHLLHGVLMTSDTPRSQAMTDPAPAPQSPCLNQAASGEPCQPDADNLKRCTICGFIVDTSYAVERPTAEYTMAGRTSRPPAAEASIEAVRVAGEAYAEATAKAARDYPDHKIPRRLIPEAKAFTDTLSALSASQAAMREALRTCETVIEANREGALAAMGVASYEGNKPECHRYKAVVDQADVLLAQCRAARASATPPAGGKE